jgi:cytochrome c oxidase cbb3-type subunit 2
VVPGSIMPAYRALAQTPLDGRHIDADLKVQQELGVPYTDEMIEMASADLVTQGTQDPDDADGLLQRYPKANIRAFTATGAATGKLTEADALIAYLQSLGTEVDFKLYDDKANIR